MCRPCQLTRALNTYADQLVSGLDATSAIVIRSLDRGFQLSERRVDAAIRTANALASTVSRKRIPSLTNGLSAAIQTVYTAATAVRYNCRPSITKVLRFAEEATRVVQGGKKGFQRSLRSLSPLCAIRLYLPQAENTAQCSYPAASTPLLVSCPPPYRKDSDSSTHDDISVLLSAPPPYQANEPDQTGLPVYSLLPCKFDDEPVCD
ncbi:hypothetical protein BDW22DRAFT_1364063 [Trametopsis cervina]|nr:hypothetical protein BDW22DRAFT_1364063 [Trametopsis cervina]